MSVSTRAGAADLVEQLTAAGIAATDDPADVLALAPCVVVAPPGVAFDVAGGATASYPLHLVPRTTSPVVAAWDQLDALLSAVADVLPVESAEAGQYGTGDDVRPAYTLTVSYLLS